MTSRFGPAQAGLFITILSAASIVAALGFEHIGGLSPCPLCLQQRMAYYAAIPLGIGAAVLVAAEMTAMARAALAVLALAMLANAGLGIYHAGAEYGFWPGPASCAASSVDFGAGGDLMGDLSAARIVPCDRAPWTLLGVSLAGFSAMMSLGLALIAALGATAELRGGEHPQGDPSV
jgi:disulfide bond formation protein DsbB